MWVDFVCFQDWVSLFYKNERTILVIVVIYARVGQVRRGRESGLDGGGEWEGRMVVLGYG